jgi:hypothetical protein
MNNKFNIGDEIKIDVFHLGGPGIKDLKPGIYIITRYRKSLSAKNQMVYDFKLKRSNSQYQYSFFQSWVEENATLNK